MRGASDTSKAIYAKLRKVMEAIDSIEKRGRNTQQNYRYFMAEDLFNDVREQFIIQGLVVIPACVGQEVTEGQTKSGGTNFMTKVHMQYTIGDAETGESITFPWAGQGQDSGDKGIWKAFTGAGKYWLKNLLILPAEDDPENDGTPPKLKSQTKPTPPATAPVTKPAPPAESKPAYIDEKQRKQLYKLAKTAGYTDAQFADVIKEQGFASSSVIPVEKYAGMVTYFGDFAPPAGGNS